MNLRSCFEGVHFGVGVLHLGNIVNIAKCILDGSSRIGRCISYSGKSLKLPWFSINLLDVGGQVQDLRIGWIWDMSTPKESWFCWDVFFFVFCHLITLHTSKILSNGFKSLFMYVLLFKTGIIWLNASATDGFYYAISRSCQALLAEVLEKQPATWLR